MERTLEAVLARLPQSNNGTASSQEPTKQSLSQCEQQNESETSQKPAICPFDRDKIVHETLKVGQCPDFRAKWIGLDETHHARIATLSKWVERWIKAAAKNEKPVKTQWMVLAGRTGTGKSHCLKAAYRFFRAHSGSLWPKFYKTPPGLKYIVWSKVVALERYCWEDFEDEVRSSRILFVDDIGSEVDRYRTGEPAERFRTFLDACKGRWLLGSSNIARNDFSRTFDARVLSLMETAAFLDLSDVPDYRPRFQEGTAIQRK